MKKNDSQQGINNGLTPDLYRELEALKIRIALAELHEEEWRDADPAEQMSEAGQHSALKAMDKGLRRRRSARFLRTTLPKAGKIAAAVLLVFFIGLTTAIASVRSVRVSILNLIMGIEESHMELGLENDALGIPAEWNGLYYPTYVPKGFELDYIDSDFPEVQYKDADGEILFFKECPSNEYINFDTEDSQVATINIHDAEALITEKDGSITIVWTLDDRYLLLRCTAPREQAIKIAESVKNVK